MDHNTRVTIMEKRGASLARLVELMERLRGEGGCPWDREQSHGSLKPYLIEEAYEVLEALEGGDDVHLAEELGDLLLQVIFHAQIASERGAFDVDDVVGAIVDKLLRRHPHVFGEAQATTAEEVRRSWVRLKAEEGKDPLHSLPLGLPALLAAHRLGEKAGEVGLDWAGPEDVLEKVREEVAEVSEALAQGDREGALAEVGDALFALASLARHLGGVGEDRLRATLGRFQERASRVEQARGGRELSPEELDRLWEQVKASH